MLLQDFRYAVRQLWKSPEFTLTTVLTLALGIGTNTAIFSLFNALVLRPIPAKDPARIVNVYRTVENENRYGVFSYPEYLDYRDHNTVFSGLAAFTGARTALTGRSGRTLRNEAGETLEALLVGKLLRGAGRRRDAWAAVYCGRGPHAEFPSRGGVEP
ncbi:MAG: hypothetical protein ABSH24_17530 [Bryobacteraceae bacterium]|jgi:hypothetical protein